ncbi:Metal-dependent amidase/aminoacylase/carboxypeptidase [Geosmithia morbida]|uniref:Peptidase M20 domain-containing protein 2 n=1 Tax=Geosmithia morbida TaxID=1094350 RepID=A0A9P4YXL0_9HYPO|nr:Metal-dependent amidase/aminoacylase/carboxypeptidase [Geosmithia morbida]KAF4123596.1 Metal-dependent amidase/aminoacylase/carboxypeptidase [Geosmithia morbida]
MTRIVFPISDNELRAAVDATLAAAHASLRALNRQVWSNPETGFQEHKAHDAICDFLEAQGFSVTRHAYGIETSFEAISGSNGRLVSFNAEYDALPGIGHACGHNLITTSSTAAFIALSALLKKYRVPGRAQLLGTPAEEGGGGKVRLIEAGAYGPVDVMLMAHAGSNDILGNVKTDGVAGVRVDATKQIEVEYTGKSAHAGGNPWDGINALDALVASYNNISILRQQIKPDERIHCAFLETPKVTNIIPSFTRANWQIRSPTLDELEVLVARARRCIEAGALATGCGVKLKEQVLPISDRGELYTDIRINEMLCERYQLHMQEYDRNVIKSIHDKVMTASTDAGNVSYVVPTLHTMFSIGAPDGVFPHEPRFQAAAGTDKAHNEAVIVGASLALVGWDMLTDDNLFNIVKKEWDEDIINRGMYTQTYLGCT